MKETARTKRRCQETTEQLAFAAMRDARATLHEAVVHAGMTVLAAMLEEDRTKLCGLRYEHDGDRRATRAGHVEGELAMGGRRVRVRRPRVRGADGRDVPLETWERFADADPLTPRAVEQMVLGVSTRNYARSLEPAPSQTRTRGTSKSAVSRRFVSATREKLAGVRPSSRSARPLAVTSPSAEHSSHLCKLRPETSPPSPLSACGEGEPFAPGEEQNGRLVLPLSASGEGVGGHRC